MRAYSTGWTKKGMFAGAVIGLVATAVAIYVWKDYWTEFDGIVSWFPIRGGRGTRGVYILLSAGSALAAFAGGVAGAILDSIADRAKGNR